MIKHVIVLNVFFLSILLFFSCNKVEQVNVVKKCYYNLYSKEGNLIGYSLRKYVFVNDTIFEKYLSVNLKGNETNSYKNVFYRKGNDVFIFSNIKNNNKKYLYFSVSKKDTCFHVNRKLGNFYLCNKGKVNFNNYKNVYKVYYDERGYDSRKESLILDKDYTILARFEDCYSYRKEIIQDKNILNKNIVLILDKAASQVLWW